TEKCAAGGRLPGRPERCAHRTCGDRRNGQVSRSRRAALEEGEVMSRERLYLFDTTLRDGAQTTGIDFSLEDKRLIARTLDALGIDYIEGGYPSANVTDTELFATDPGLKHATFTAFGMTKRAGRSIANDPGF